MPRSGMRWRHVMINTKATWLHGDQRGFRNRDHRIHSSGDYKHRPPTGEHAGLHRYMEDRGNGEVTIPYDLRPIIGRVIVQWLLEQGYRVLAIAVGKVHTHLLVELKNDIRVIKIVIGEAKRKSSRAVKKRLPGSIWSAGLNPEPVDNPRHQRKAFEYILYEQGPGAWTWSFLDKSFDGVFNRQRPPKNPGRRCALPRRGKKDRR